MKQKLLLVFLAALLMPALSRAKAPAESIDVRQAFEGLGIDVVELLDPENRSIMLQLYDQDSIPSLPNSVGGMATLNKVSSDFLEVELTDVSTLQLKVLKSSSGDDILMTLYTIGATDDTRETEVRFFNATLKELDSRKLLPTLPLSAFFSFPKGTKTKMKEIEALIPFETIDFSANPDNSDLRATLTVESALNVEDAKIVELFMLPNITLRWNGKKFQRL